jgi:hypothetical protein
VYHCLRALSGGIACNYDANCATSTYTVGQEPSPTPSLGINLIASDGGFESGALGKWVITSQGLTHASSPTAVTNSQAKTSNYSLVTRFDNRSMLVRQVTLAGFRIEPGAQYEFSLSCLHTNVNARTDVYLFAYPMEAIDSPTESSMNGYPVNQWRTRRVKFMATMSFVNLQVHMVFATRGTSGSVEGMDELYVDGLSLVRVA